MRDPGTLFFALLIPMLQLFLFGFAVDTNVRQIATVVLDESHTQESRRLLETLRRLRRVRSEDLRRLAGRDVRGDSLPERRAPAFAFPMTMRGACRTAPRPPSWCSSTDPTPRVAGQAMSTSTGVALKESLVRVLPDGTMPIEVRPSVLYNPATRSANFFVPGLIAILLQMMAILMIALSLVRERERGTLEQLTMTPVAPLGLMVGKMIPYGALAFGELCAILLVMRAGLPGADSRQRASAAACSPCRFCSRCWASGW